MDKDGITVKKSGLFRFNRAHNRYTQPWGWWKEFVLTYLGINYPYPFPTGEASLQIIRTEWISVIPHWWIAKWRKAAVKYVNWRYDSWVIPVSFDNNGNLLLARPCYGQYAPRQHEGISRINNVQNQELIAGSPTPLFCCPTRLLPDQNHLGIQKSYI